MRSNDYKFSSVFANEMNAYLQLRASQGHNHVREKYIFVLLDQYLIREQVTDQALTAVTIEGWLQSLPAEMSINTKIVYISHYSQFAKYLISIGISAFIPERPIEDKSYVPYVFSEDEIARIFVVADNIDSKPQCDRLLRVAFPLILRILYGCGLRLEEALKLRVSDVDIDNGTLTVSKTKGSKERVVPMDTSLTAILERYIQSRHNNSTPEMLLFSARNGKKIYAATMRDNFNRTLTLAEIQKPDLPKYTRNICLHCLRHTFAVHSFRKQDRAGVDMYTTEPLLSIFMGHDNMDGTELYLHMTAETGGDIIQQTSKHTAGLFPEVPL